MNHRNSEQQLKSLRVTYFFCRRLTRLVIYLLRGPEAMNDRETGSSALHHVLIRTIIDTGGCAPSHEQAWNNVHAHCAMLLPFRSEQEVREWSVRH